MKTAKTADAEKRLDIYVIEMPKDLDMRPLWPPLRDKQIKETKGETLRAQRRAVWLLLEEAIAGSFGYSMSELHFTENHDKWKCDELHFSLSHCRDALAVAVSNAPCGVDIESMERFHGRYSDPVKLEKMVRRICTPGETVSSHQELAKLWTMKEALYKCRGSSEPFVPKNCSDYRECVSEIVSLSREYMVSICGDSISSLRIIKKM